MSDSKLDFNQSMARLEEINQWFETDDLDLEEALGKLKEGKELIKSCKNRLDQIENEFIELKADLDIDAEEKDNSDQEKVDNQSSNGDDEAIAEDIPF